eukprot:TRINITY_DN13441_c0_g1_i1.p1 TRINITY_DN13441_c0_g1~~TRINITY_DN13441_c0_g1_i1.p1  ORF type:complete len:433 (+),score=126.13 TRINITY_DN13441_c0_g1_i1:181-1479(+)
MASVEEQLELCRGRLEEVEKELDSERRQQLADFVRISKAHRALRDLHEREAAAERRAQKAESDLAAALSSASSYKEQLAVAETLSRQRGAALEIERERWAAERQELKAMAAPPAPGPGELEVAHARHRESQFRWWAAHSRRQLSQCKEPADAVRRLLREMADVVGSAVKDVGRVLDAARARDAAVAHGLARSACMLAAAREEVAAEEQRCRAVAWSAFAARRRVVAAQAVEEAQRVDVEQAFARWFGPAAASEVAQRPPPPAPRPAPAAPGSVVMVRCLPATGNDLAGVEAAVLEMRPGEVRLDLPAPYRDNWLPATRKHLYPLRCTVAAALKPGVPAAEAQVLEQVSRAAAQAEEARGAWAASRRRSLSYNNARQRESIQRREADGRGDVEGRWLVELLAIGAGGAAGAPSPAMREVDMAAVRQLVLGGRE